MIIFSKEIIKTKGEKGESNIMISQRFFDTNSMFSYDPDDPSKVYEKTAKEFIKGKHYKSILVVTNTSSNSMELNVID